MQTYIFNNKINSNKFGIVIPQFPNILATFREESVLINFNPNASTSVA